MGDKCLVLDSPVTVRGSEVGDIDRTLSDRELDSFIIGMDIEVDITVDDEVVSVWLIRSIVTTGYAALLYIATKWPGTIH